jgi:FkbM family methyltransferase
MILNLIPLYKNKKNHFEILTKLRSQEKAVQALMQLSLSNKKFKKFLSFYQKNHLKSNSRHLTDLLALFILGPNKKFIEIGASHPINASDTYLLEKFYGWKGIQIEPNPSDCKKLRNKRTSSVICAAVVSEADIAKKMYLDKYLGKVSNKKIGNPIPLITLEVLRKQFGTNFDALFIDVEGMESDIINSKTFEQFNFQFVSLERIWKSKEIHLRMLSLGYVNILGDISGYESWWVREPHSKLWLN